MIYIKLYMTSLASVPCGITYEFRSVAEGKISVAFWDTNKRNPTIFIHINTSATLRNSNKRRREYLFWSRFHFPYTVCSLVAKVAKTSVRLPRFSRRNPWTTDSLHFRLLIREIRSWIRRSLKYQHTLIKVCGKKVIYWKLWVILD